MGWLIGSQIGHNTPVMQMSIDAKRGAVTSHPCTWLRNTQDRFQRVASMLVALSFPSFLNPFLSINRSLPCSHWLPRSVHSSYDSLSQCQVLRSPFFPARFSARQGCKRKQCNPISAHETRAIARLPTREGRATKARASLPAILPSSPSLPSPSSDSLSCLLLCFLWCFLWCFLCFRLWWWECSEGPASVSSSCPDPSPPSVYSVPRADALLIALL